MPALFYYFNLVTSKIFWVPVVLGLLLDTCHLSHICEFFFLSWWESWLAIRQGLQVSWRRGGREVAPNASLLRLLRLSIPGIDDGHDVLEPLQASSWEFCTVDCELRPADEIPCAHSEWIIQCILFHRFNAEGMQNGIVSSKRRSPY